jgi:hypothetical protein
LPSRLDINSVDRPITVLHAQVIDSSLTSDVCARALGLPADPRAEDVLSRGQWAG